MPDLHIWQAEPAKKTPNYISAEQIVANLRRSGRVTVTYEIAGSDPPVALASIRRHSLFIAWFPDKRMRDRNHGANALPSLERLYEALALAIATPNPAEHVLIVAAGFLPPSYLPEITNSHRFGEATDTLRLEKAIYTRLGLRGVNADHITTSDRNGENNESAPTSKKATISEEGTIWSIYNILGGGNTQTGKQSEPNNRLLLVGPEGIGKTTIAKLYKKRFGQRYEGGVIWTDASDGIAEPTSPTDAYWTSLVKQLEVAAVDAESGSPKERLTEHIEQTRKPWLWIVDDLPIRHVQAPWNNWICDLPNVWMLATARSLPADYDGVSISPETLPTEYCGDLLTRYVTNPNQESKRAADHISRVAGHIPRTILALREDIVARQIATSLQTTKDGTRDDCSYTGLLCRLASDQSALNHALISASDNVISTITPNERRMLTIIGCLPIAEVPGGLLRYLAEQIYRMPPREAESTLGSLRNKGILALPRVTLGQNDCVQVRIPFIPMHFTHSETELVQNGRSLTVATRSLAGAYLHREMGAFDGCADEKGPAAAVIGFALELAILQLDDSTAIASPVDEQSYQGLVKKIVRAAVQSGRFDIAVQAAETLERQTNGQCPGTSVLSSAAFDHGEARALSGDYERGLDIMHQAIVSINIHEGPENHQIAIELIDRLHLVLRRAMLIDRSSQLANNAANWMKGLDLLPLRCPEQARFNIMRNLTNFATESSVAEVNHVHSLYCAKYGNVDYRTVLAQIDVISTMVPRTAEQAVMLSNMCDNLWRRLNEVLGPGHWLTMISRHAKEEPRDDDASDELKSAQKLDVASDIEIIFGLGHPFSSAAWVEWATTVLDDGEHRPSAIEVTDAYPPFRPDFYGRFGTKLINDKSFIRNTWMFTVPAVASGLSPIVYLTYVRVLKPILNGERKLSTLLTALASSAVQGLSLFVLVLLAMTAAFVAGIFFRHKLARRRPYRELPFLEGRRG